MSRLTQGLSALYVYGAITRFGRTFQTVLLYLQTTTGLFRVRSPLLAESLLMSFPPGTEMFQFPGFASLHYVFMQRYPCGWVAPFGYPRINACSRLPVAFRSVPRPSSPPGAKASTECPSYTRYLRRRSEEPRPPCTETILRLQLSGFSRQLSETTATETIDCSRTVLEISTPHTTGSLESPFVDCLRDHREENSTKSFTTPLNPRRQPLGRCPHRQQFPVRQFGRTTHQFSGVGCQDQNRIDRPNPCTNTLLMTRPETHQNLIHISKEQYDHPQH